MNTMLKDLKTPSTMFAKDLIDKYTFDFIG